VLLAILKSLVFIKAFLTAFFSFLLKPIWKIVKFVFFKILVKVYLNYLVLVKRLGWDKWRGSFVAFLLNQRAVHVFVIFLAVLIAFFGIWSKYGQAKTLSEMAGKTLLAKMVAGEFIEIAEAEDSLIEETMGDSSLSSHTQFRYDNSQEAVVGRLGVSTSTQEYLEEEMAMRLLSNEDDVLVKPEMATTKISKKTRKDAMEYTVQPGDSVSTIAADFDISVNTILWENNLTAYSLIRPGDKLVILPATGVNHKVAKGETLGAISSKYDIDAEAILLANNMADNSPLTIGQKLFIPGGRKYYVAPPPAPKPAASAYNPITVIKDLINPDADNVPANKMFWPAKGIITQYYTWRHHGLDIANKQGTPIYACDAGTIVHSGWSKAGYGNMIEIDHGGGKHTRYGHFYQLSVKVGDVVKRGQVIGLMGTTGKSTGPHLHLEVRINNVTYNPLSYIK
jgi:murein DD-endopeptidase MepM/ murein hydrolase activator NlpD